MRFDNQIWWGYVYQWYSSILIHAAVKNNTKLKESAAGIVKSKLIFLNNQVFNSNFNIPNCGVFLEWDRNCFEDINVIDDNHPRICFIQCKSKTKENSQTKKEVFIEAFSKFSENVNVPHLEKWKFVIMMNTSLSKKMRDIFRNDASNNADALDFILRTVEHSLGKENVFKKNSRKRTLSRLLTLKKHEYTGENLCKYLEPEIAKKYSKDRKIAEKSAGDFLRISKLLDNTVILDELELNEICNTLRNFLPGWDDELRISFAKATHVATMIPEPDCDDSSKYERLWVKFSQLKSKSWWWLLKL